MFTTRLADLVISRGARQSSALNRPADRTRDAVVITGGSRGIGKALAKQFASIGYAVVIVARNKQGLDAAASEIEQALPTARIEKIVCNITDAHAPETIKQALRDFGLEIDILVNNAGIGLSGAFVGQSPDRIDQLLKTNIGSLTRLSHAVLPLLLKRARGGLINIGSLGGYVPGPNQAAYYASKAYVQSLTEALAYENAGQGVRFLAVMPGPVQTRFHADMGANQSYYRWLIPPVTPDRVARSTLWAYHLGRTVVVPGLINKVLATAVRYLPHLITVPIIGLLLKRFGEEEAQYYSPEG